MKILLLMLLAVFITSCSVEEEEVKYQPYVGPDMVLKDAETLYSDSTILRVRLRAPVQYQFKSGDQEYPDGVHIKFFNEEGEPSSQLTSNSGKYNAERDIYTVTGNVIVKSLEEDKILKTEELNWYPDEEKIKTDKFVTIKTPTEFLQGTGMVANQDFSEYEVFNPVLEMEE